MKKIFIGKVYYSWEELIKHCEIKHCSISNKNDILGKSLKKISNLIVKEFLKLSIFFIYIVKIEF